MPTQLDHVSATVNGKSAYVYFSSPTQINILTPPDAMNGPAQVVVTNNGRMSAAFTVQAQPISPSFFVFRESPYVAAEHSTTEVSSVRLRSIRDRAPQPIPASRLCSTPAALGPHGSPPKRINLAGRNAV